MNAQNASQDPQEELSALRTRVAELEGVTGRLRQAESGTRETMHLLQGLVRAMRDAVFLIDADSVKILDCNPASTKIFGYARAEVVGRTPDFLHVDAASLEEFRKQLYPAVERDGSFHGFEFRMKRKDGTVFPTEHSVMPLLDNAGSRAGWVSIVRDISERRRTQEALRESEEGYHRLFDTGPDATMIFDAETRRFIDVNDACVRLYGYSRAEFLAMTQTEISAEPAASDASIRETVAGMRDGVPLRYHRKKDGTLFPVEISARRFPG